MFSQILKELLTWQSLLGLLIGVVGGMVIGALPGLSATMGVALMIPISYGMDAVPALIMLSSVYTTATYGGSITAILLHTPGTPSSAATALDGYELTKQGKGLQAIGMSTISSMVGGVFSAVMLLLLAIRFNDHCFACRRKHDQRSVCWCVRSGDLLYRNG